MRSILLTLSITLLTIAPPTTSISFPFAASQPGAFSPPTRNWARDVDAKVADPHVKRAHHAASSSSNFPTEHKVISNICDANANLEFGKCYRTVKKEIEGSVKAYCKVMEGRWEACKSGSEERKVEGRCVQEEAEYEGCARFTYSTYAHCLTYSYSGLPSTTHCANTELSLLTGPDPASRPLMAIRAPIPVPVPIVATIPFYSNNCIGYKTTSYYATATSTPTYGNSSSSTSSNSSSSTTASIGGAGRNGTYVSPTLTATTPSVSVSGSGRNGTLPSTVSLPPGYTGAGVVSSEQAGTIPTDVPISNNTSSSSPSSSSSAPVIGGGNRVGTFTSDGSVCTRYTGVATLLV